MLARSVKIDGRIFQYTTLACYEKTTWVCGQSALQEI